MLDLNTYTNKFGTSNPEVIIVPILLQSVKRNYIAEVTNTYNK